MSENAANDRVFDDRIDTNSRIGNREVLRILTRSLKELVTEKRLFFAKLGFGVLALIPGLYLPWIVKVVVDQVLLQQPFDESIVRFPPHMTPFIELLQGLGPMEIMLAITVALFLMLLLFSRDAGVYQSVAEGQDSATQSENAMNTGVSEVSGLFGVVESMVQIRLSQRLSNRLRTRLFRRMARMPMTTLNAHRIGDAVYRVMYDAPMLPQMCYRVTLDPVFLIIGGALSLYFMSYSYGEVAPELVWTAAAMIPAGLLVTMPFSGLVRGVQQDSRSAGAATTNAMEEGLSNIAAVQSLGGMEREKARIETRSRESFRRFLRVKIVGVVIELMRMIGLTAFLMWVFVFVTDKIIDGVMTPGDWGVLFGIGMSLGGTALGLGTLWIDLQDKAAAVRRVFFFIDQPSEDAQAHQRLLTEFNEQVQFEHVGFHYPDGRSALHSVNLTLKKGELVAIVGPTGAGKTSLAFMIPGYLQPSQGRVLVDGEDTREVQLDSLRDLVTYVFQEHTLLSESIRNNLVMVKPNATEAEMRTALATASALEFVDALDDGLDTILGRDGDTLSVGQKQRLCIARGLLRNTPILILDEPTAALDPQTENALVDTLQAASVRRLVIVIAHRLSTIRRADRIVFLEQGEIRAVGSHDALMVDPENPYRRFVQLQQGGDAD